MQAFTLSPHCPPRLLIVWVWKFTSDIGDTGDSAKTPLHGLASRGFVVVAAVAGGGIVATENEPQRRSTVPLGVVP